MEESHHLEKKKNLKEHLINLKGINAVKSEDSAVSPLYPMASGECWEAP